MNKCIEAGFKKIKLFWDAYKIIIGVVALITSIGGGGYALYGESEPVTEALPVSEEANISEPEYALKGHIHQQPVQIIIDHSPAIKHAISEYEEKHLKLKH